MASPIILSPIFSWRKTYQIYWSWVLLGDVGALMEGAIFQESSLSWAWLRFLFSVLGMGRHRFVSAWSLLSLPKSTNRGAYSQKNWVGMCGPLLKTLTLFMTKICNFPYPMNDLTRNSMPSLWPDPLINTLFQTCLIISYLVQTDVKGIVKGFCWRFYR